MTTLTPRERIKAIQQEVATMRARAGELQLELLQALDAEIQAIALDCSDLKTLSSTMNDLQALGGRR